MRAVLHFKSPNLSWKAVQNHFKAYSTTINAASIVNINTKFVSNFSKSVDWPDARLGPLNKLNSNFPLPGNVSSFEGFCSSSTLLHKPKEDDHVLSDIFSEQIPVIEQSHEDLFEKSISITAEALECTVHSCLLPLRRELSDLFPDRKLASSDSILSVLCLNHHTKANMSAWDSSVAKERELLAQLFVISAKDICYSLNQCGFWADFIDPYSGTPFFGGHTNSTLFETDPRMRHFGLQILDLGCCKVLSHPAWRENVFSALIFTDAPADHPALSSLGRESH